MEAGDGLLVTAAAAAAHVLATLRDTHAYVLRATTSYLPAVLSTLPQMVTSWSQKLTNSCPFYVCFVCLIVCVCVCVCVKSTGAWTD